MVNGLYNGLDNGLQKGAYSGMSGGVSNGLFDNETFFKKKIIARNIVLQESSLDYRSYNQGATTIKDLSVNSVTGTLYNVTYNPISKGLKFNGTSSYVDTGKSLKAYGVNDNYTISVWVKYTASQTGMIFSQRENTAAFGNITIGVANASDFSLAGTKIAFHRGGLHVQGLRQTISNNSYNDNRWHQITLVADYLFDIMYIDGKQVAISNLGANNIIGPVNSKTFLGVAGSNLVPLGSPYYFNGEIGEVIFMETILNANEVRHNFEATKMDYMQL